MADDTFRIRFREALAGTDYTQEALAREIDVSLRTVQLWLAGPKEPRGRHLVRMAEALGREPGWFFSEPEDVAA